MLLIILFLVLHFNFLFVPCGRLSWLPVSFLLHVRPNTLLDKNNRDTPPLPMSRSSLAERDKNRDR